MSAVSEARPTISSVRRVIASVVPQHRAAESPWTPGARVGDSLEPSRSSVTGPDLATLDVEVMFDPTAPLVAVVGEVDALTAPMLTSVLGSIACGVCVELTLDLAGCTFMGAAGLRTIVETSTSLGASGGTLTIRDASALTLRILDITVVNQLVNLESSTGVHR